MCFYQTPVMQFPCPKRIVFRMGHCNVRIYVWYVTEVMEYRANLSDWRGLQLADCAGLRCRGKYI